MDDKKLPSELILTLSYRRIVFRIYYLILFGTLLSLLIIGRIHYHELLRVHWYEALLKWVLASTIPLTILIRSVLFFHPRLYCEYRLDGSKLILFRKKRIREVYFSQVDKLSISKWSPRFLGGFSITLKSGAKFRFLPLLENSHLLLKKIIDSRPDLSGDIQIEKYMKQAPLIEDSWARIRDKMRSWKMGLIKYIAMPAGLAQIGLLRGWRWPPYAERMDQYLFLFLFIFLVTLVLSLFVNHFEEKLNQRHQLNNKVDDQIVRDPVHEKKLDNVAHAITLIAVLATFYLFTF